mgnify:CR=1 FL=1
MSRDPEGFVDGCNLYAFVESRPLLGTDPLGLYMCCHQWEAVFDIGNYDSPDDCADALMNQMWWWDMPEGGILTIGTAFTGGTMGGPYGQTLAFSTSLGGMYSYTSFLEYCSGYMCQDRYRPERVVCEDGYFLDTVRYECEPGDELYYPGTLWFEDPWTLPDSREEWE